VAQQSDCAGKPAAYEKSEIGQEPFTAKASVAPKDVDDTSTSVQNLLAARA